jgi:hypothetical protein
MPFASIPQSEPVTHRDRRVMVIIGVVVLVVVAGIGIWAAVKPGSYGASRNGCITVNIPSTMGGSLVHGCGAKAQSMCRNAYAGQGIAVRLVRQQCRIADIAPAQASAAPSAG